MILAVKIIALQVPKYASYIANGIVSFQNIPLHDWFYDFDSTFKDFSRTFHGLTDQMNKLSFYSDGKIKGTKITILLKVKST